MTPRFAVGVLLHGDYPVLARRVLGPLLPHAREGTISLSVAAAESSGVAAEYAIPAVVRAGGVYTPRPNVGKYPIMREMVAAADAEYFMWFDDDSFIRPDAASTFFDQAASVMGVYDLIGSRYTIGLRPGQFGWIGRQPWYAGRAIPTVAGRREVSFFQGGWWCARLGKLREWDYPWAELHHNGGDVMLGVLAAQRGWQACAWAGGVAINADEHGNESRAVRRGMSTLPIGATS